MLDNSPSASDFGLSDSQRFEEIFVVEFIVCRSDLNL